MKRFHQPFPRKGTETYQERLIEYLRGRFHQPFPRKGTETCMGIANEETATRVSINHFPARGLKLPSSL